MKKLLLTSLSGWLAASGWAATNPAPPAAADLLEKFAAAHKPFNSFIAEYETTEQRDYNVPRVWHGNQSDTGETRYDGQRASDRRHTWGRMGPDADRPRSKPLYQSFLFDGQADYAYFRDDNASGTNAGKLSLWTPRTLSEQLAEALNRGGSPLCEPFGCLPLDNGVSIYARLRDAPLIRVRDRLEPADAAASPCYALEAETPYGHFTLWLDPAHGYHLAKATLRCRPGHLDSRRQPLAQGDAWSSTVEKVRFEQRDGRWLPVEWTSGFDLAEKRGSHMRITNHTKITHFVLNPDHAALRSFKPDDIRNGAAAAINPTLRTGTNYLLRWQDGCIADKEGKVLFESRMNPAKTNGATSAISLPMPWR